MSVSLRKHGDYVIWNWLLADGSRTWDCVMIEEVWENDMYVVRIENTEDQHIVFGSELS